MRFLKKFESFEKAQPLTPQTIKMGSKGEHVRRVQTALDKLGFKLPIYGIDSKVGYETMGVIKSFFNYMKSHSKFHEFVDDESILDIRNNEMTPEQQDFLVEVSDDEDLKSEISNYFKEIDDKIKNSNFIGKKEIARNIESPEQFLSKLVEISKSLQINPNWLLIVMWKESKINPKAVNKNSGASGLIQFMPRTAKWLGTSVEQIREMTGTEQLDYVFKYFKSYAGKIKTVQDLYLITFFPAALGKDDDFVIHSKDLSAEKVADANPVIDINKDRQITKSEFNDYVTNNLPSSWKDEGDKKMAA